MSSPEGRGRRRAVSWADELRLIDDRLETEEEYARTHLRPGWDDSHIRWETLRGEWDRLLFIRTELGWLSGDAAARVDRCLRAAGEIIDAENNNMAREAALRLRQAEQVMQRAWRSRHSYTPGYPYFLSLPLMLSMSLLWAFAVAAGVIYSQELFPTGEGFELDKAFTAAALWGLVGGLINGLITLLHRLQTQTFDPDRALWYSITPIVGLALGAVSFLLFLAGILSVGATLEGGTSQAVQEGGNALTRTVDPAPVLVIAVLAGFSQNAFLNALHRAGERRFGPPSEEETQ